MRKQLSESDIEKRFSEINSLEPEKLTADEDRALEAAQAINDGSTVSLDDYVSDLEAYSGRLVLRIPRSLHKSLKERAAAEGISLNQYLIYKLAQ